MRPWTKSKENQQKSGSAKTKTKRVRKKILVPQKDKANPHEEKGLLGRRLQSLSDIEFHFLRMVTISKLITIMEEKNLMIASKLMPRLQNKPLIEDNNKAMGKFFRRKSSRSRPYF